MRSNVAERSCFHRNDWVLFTEGSLRMNASVHRFVFSPKLAILEFQGRWNDVGTTRNASQCNFVSGEVGLMDRKCCGEKM